MKKVPGQSGAICRRLFLLAAAALALLESGMTMSRTGSKLAAGAGRSFLAVARVGSLVGGSTARSCTIYLNDAGRFQIAEEETGGTLHGLAEGRGNTGSFLREMGQEAPPREASPPGKLPISEHYAARLAVTSLSADGRYRAESYEASAAPPRLLDLVQRIESNARARHFPAAPAGLYGRARRQLHFDPEIEKLHATFSAAQLDGLPLLSSLLRAEMSLVRLGTLGEPGLLAKGLTVVPGRAVRVKAGDLVYVVEAYELRSLQGREGEPCPSSSMSHP